MVFSDRELFRRDDVKLIKTVSEVGGGWISDSDVC